MENRGKIKEIFRTNIIKAKNNLLTFRNHGWGTFSKCGVELDYNNALVASVLNN
jgi:hypothetical protein